MNCYKFKVSNEVNFICYIITIGMCSDKILNSVNMESQSKRIDLI